MHELSKANAGSAKMYMQCTHFSIVAPSAGIWGQNFFVGRKCE